MYQNQDKDAKPSQKPLASSKAPNQSFKIMDDICNFKVKIWRFGGSWKFLTGVWHPYIDMDIVSGLWYTHIPNFGSLS